MSSCVDDCSGDVLRLCLFRRAKQRPRPIELTPAIPEESRELSAPTPSAHRVSSRDQRERDPRLDGSSLHWNAPARAIAPEPLVLVSSCRYFLLLLSNF